MKQNSKARRDHKSHAKHSAQHFHTEICFFEFTVKWVPDQHKPGKGEKENANWLQNEVKQANVCCQVTQEAWLPRNTD